MVYEDVKLVTALQISFDNHTTQFSMFENVFIILTIVVALS